MKRKKTGVKRASGHVWRKRVLTVALATLLLLTSSGIQGFASNAASGDGGNTGTVLDAGSEKTGENSEGMNQEKSEGMDQENGIGSGDQNASGDGSVENGEGGPTGEGGAAEEGDVAGEGGPTGEGGPVGEGGTVEDGGAAEEGDVAGEGGPTGEGGAAEEGDVAGEGGPTGEGGPAEEGDVAGEGGPVGEGGIAGESDMQTEGDGAEENSTYSGENLTEGFVFVMVPLTYRGMQKAARSERETVNFEKGKYIAYPDWLMVEDDYLEIGTPNAWGTNSFTVNGKTAYCVESYKGAPETNSNAVAEAYMNNTLLQKVLYYGYDCPGDIGFFSSYTDDEKYILTHIAASYAYLQYEWDGISGYYPKMAFYGCSKDGYDIVMDFIGTIEDLSAPGELNMTLNPTEGNVTEINPETGEQTSESFRLTGLDANSYITITPDEGIRCYVGNEERTRIYGGETFYLKADRNVTGIWSSGNIAGNYTNIWRTLIIKSERVQDIGYAEFYEESENALELKVNWKNVLCLRMLKQDADNGEKISGVQFGIYGSVADAESEANAIIVLTTDESGEASCYLSGDLQQVYIKELKASDGYVMDSEIKVVSLGEAENQTVVYIATNKKTEVKISKRAVTGTAEIAGAKLQLFDKNDNMVKEWTSGSKPKSITGLTPGEYTLKETEAPDGYCLAAAVTFTLHEDGTVTQKGESCEDCTVVMRDAKRKLSFAKLSEESTDEKPVYLAGAKLEIHRQIETGGTVTMEEEAAETVDGIKLEWTSGTEPKVFEGIKKGSYYLVETEAPHGYVKAEPVRFEVSGEAMDEDAPVVIQMIDCRTRVRIQKVFESVDGQTYELSEKNPVTFNIYKVEEKGSESFQRAITLTSAEPYVIEGLPVGNYILREISAPPGFTLAEDVKFEIVEGMEGEVAITTEVKVTNRAAEFKVSKVDIANVKNALSGAKLEILNADTKEAAVTAYGETLSWTSGSEPKVIRGLAAGRYILHEKSAPKGYDRAEDISFEIKSDGSIVSGAVDQNGVLLMKDKKHEDETEETEGTEGTEETRESEEENEKESKTSESREESAAEITGTDGIDQSGGHIGVQSGDDSPVLESALMLAAAVALIAVLFALRGKRRKS